MRFQRNYALIITQPTLRGSGYATFLLSVMILLITITVYEY